MSKVVFSISMSLDGFIAATGRTPEDGLGKGGEALHEWIFKGDEATQTFVAEAGASAGAIVVGRRTYDDSIRWWGADGPTGDRRLPVFVVTHKPPAESPENGVYTFVAGVPAAIAAARKAAGDKVVAIGGGSATAVQAIELGLVDEIAIDIAPLLLGDGLRLTESLGRHVRLEQIQVTETNLAAHVRYRVVK